MSEESKASLEPPMPELRALSDLLAEQLADGEEVEECTTKPATAVGENYGSTALALDVLIKNKKQTDGGGGADGCRHLHAFCKMLPTDPERRMIFSVYTTFVKELQMYTLAVPAMQQLQTDHGVPEEDHVDKLVPRCYGGRCSLNGDTKVDDDAAIVLEDMRRRGFATGDRVSGLDLGHCRLILEKLAVLHALAVALRVRRPQVFADTVQQACRHFKMGEGMKDFGDDSHKFLACITHNVKKSPEAARYLDVVERQCTMAGFGAQEKIPPVREPFASICHNDLWTNNILVQRDLNASGRPEAVAFIDFQITRINSPFKDVVFFLLTSASIEVTTSHLDELFEAYHASFCRCLTQVGVDPAPFSLAAAWREMNELAHTELYHALCMLRFTNADPAMIRANPETFVFMPELGGEAYARRVEHIVLLFAKRGWFNAQ